MYPTSKAPKRNYQRTAPPRSITLYLPASVLPFSKEVEVYICVIFLYFCVMDSPFPRILVLVDTSSGWGRRLIRGIANYSLTHGPWQLLVQDKAALAPLEIKASREVDGIIARVSDKRLYHEVLKSGQPAVNVSGIILEDVDLPRVTTDYDAIATLALRHFTERGFRNLAYCGLIDRPYGQRHCSAYVDAADHIGLSCNVFHASSQGGRPSWKSEQAQLLRWLNDLPKPVAIFTWGDSMGRDILNLCHEQGMSVPEQVAVLGGDDDELLCEVCHPPLSAIVTPSEQIGYEAARLLDAMLRGDSPPSTPTLLSPTEVVTRQSTDTLAISDPELGQAIRFIRDHVHRPIQVTDVAEAAGISRRALERRFENLLGHSPAKEIQETRLRVAKRLLRETDMSVADVAAASGYGSNEYMIRVFQKATDHTPLKYRSWVRATS